MMLKKQDIYSYLNGKFVKRHEELQKKYEDLTKHISNNVLDDLSETIDKANNAMTIFSNHFGNLPEKDYAYEYKRASYSHKGKSFKSDYESHIQTVFTINTSRTRLREIHPLANDPLEKHIVLYNKYLLKARKEKEELEKLKAELEQVVKNEANGKQAKKALIALGVDMSELTEDTVTLPAIQKLSVDPSILNM